MISFTGVLSGDMECFCWDNVPESERIDIVGEKIHKIEKDGGEPVDVLYPNDIFTKLGLEYGKKYRFTISAEPVD